MKEALASVIGIVSGGLLFALLCLIFDAPTLKHFVFASLVGGFTGLLAAPEIAPEYYRCPKVFQVTSGAGIGLGVGLFFSVGTLYLASLCAAGAVVGYFAKYFIDAVHVP